MKKRIETLFVQFRDQFMLKRNYANTILKRINPYSIEHSAGTLFQYIN